MKRIAFYLMLIAVICAATPAFAVTRWSYNPSSFSQIRILAQWAIGNQRIKVFTTDSCVNGERVFTANSIWLNHFTGEITIQQDRSVVIGVCQ